MKLFRSLVLTAVLFVTAATSFCQAPNKSNLVYVDKKGVLRYNKDNKEASFFGVNYTVPFAYSYRAHKALNVDVEKAILQDVYQMARLGLDAFRVHVWDTEISDSLGNLLQNEHLRLFDFLLSELKKRNIKTIITPIAFWGNGYPERDEVTPGFSRKYGKGNATTNEAAIAAQENYWKQLFRHVNPYTNLTYVNDPDVIAVELNNEPSHSGTKQSVTNYINRLVVAMKSVGWTKPLYYNIAQNPYYADAVAKAIIDGVSFQWYPTGLVAGHEQKGNLLPNVDHYTIPFDTIPEYRSKSRMVYEFDAADVLQSCMYPAMARSFREAGFQWATQFAYDPTVLAYANTEYQTHYLNLLYTPSKAISLLIASKAFHRLPRLKSFGSYPADSSFDVFRASYKNSLSEMNTAEEFYYSNSTYTKPLDANKLKHVAGVGSSAAVQYEGTGAYFLDQIAEGVWRLEVMPDAVHIRDPFERASPKKEVTVLQWQSNTMQIFLPGLSSFTFKGINEQNTFSGSASGKFQIKPGTYLLTASNAATPKTDITRLNEFAGARPLLNEPFVAHEPFKEVTAGKPFIVSARIIGIDSGRVTLQISKRGGGLGSSRILSMTRMSSSTYSAEVPAELVTPGLLTYRMILQEGNDYTTFPGAHKGNPVAWDNLDNDYWQTFVVTSRAKLEIFNATVDEQMRTYPRYSRGFQMSYPTDIEPRQLLLRLSSTEVSSKHPMALAHYFADDVKGRLSEIDSFDRLVIRARNLESEPASAKITLVNKDAFAFSTSITLASSFRDIEVYLDKLVLDSMMLLPRPYPEFMPLWFKGSGSSLFHLSDIEQIQVSVGADFVEGAVRRPCNIEISSIWLEKKK
jgi:hypothetical protein